MLFVLDLCVALQSTSMHVSVNEDTFHSLNWLREDLFSLYIDSKCMGRPEVLVPVGYRHDYSGYLDLQFSMSANRPDPVGQPQPAL